jgi:predicted ribosome quality control (RQC) complex YloA/Tae2 family protein
LLLRVISCDFVDRSYPTEQKARNLIPTQPTRHPAGLYVLISLLETMDDHAIKEIVAEIQPLMLGRVPGKIFQLSPLSLVIDFRLRDHGDLFISVEPAQPRIYLVKRRVRDLEKQSIPLTAFSQGLRKELTDTTLQSIEKDPDDRIVWFHFSGVDELGRNLKRTIIAQLTGRAANLFLIDPQGVITNQAREGKAPGQTIGQPYQKPPPAGGRPSTVRDELSKTIRDGRHASASAAADAYFTSLLVRQSFDNRAGAARAELRKKLAHQTRLMKQLELDLASHANAETHKRLGDLLLANLSTAKREGQRVILIDYFADDAAPLEIEMDEHSTLPEEAERRFALYSRSRRAVRQITSRIAAIRPELDALTAQSEVLEKIIAERDEAALEKFTAKKSATRALPTGSKQKTEKKIPGARSYLSSDGFEILVGRTSRDNDYLTFKVAKPNDLWLHTGDYSGSHVVVRNATRKDVPHRTLIEAAQLAAHFSQARKDPKVDVHYTQRKFVSKPKGAVPGLVRLTRFKNILVEPKEGVPRLER